MLKILIDGQCADIEQGCDLGVSLSVDELASMEWGRVVYAKGVVIPLTPNNRAIMGQAESPLMVERFNDEEHTVQVEWNGSVVAQGFVHLTEVGLGFGGGYKFDIVGHDRQWVKNANKTIAQMNVDFQATLSNDTIKQSWTSEGDLVRFLPVERGLWRTRDAQGRRLGIVDYHPFIHLGGLVERVFEQDGYSVCSKWLGSEWVQRLYMSGRWKHNYNVNDAVEKYNFVAFRSSESGAVAADYDGKVVASPLVSSSTVGNLVDTTDYKGGVNNGDCFGVSYDGRIYFRPKEKVTVAFEYRLNYRTDTKVLSRYDLQGFDQIHTCDGQIVRLPIKNTNSDRRYTTLSGSYSYKLFIFEPNPNVEYRLECRRTMNGVVEEVELLTTQSAVTIISLTSGATYSNFRLIAKEGIAEVEAVADWAIYNGYVQPEGSTTVSVTLVSNPVVASASKPIYFDTFAFGGAEQGMEINLQEGCSIRPLFVDVPLEDEKINWSSVADFDQSPMELLESLKNLFDLEFRTDQQQKVVYIEPKGGFYNNRVVELTEQIDWTEPVVVSDVANHCPKNIEVGYAAGDSLVDQHSKYEGVPYGEWKVELNRCFATKQVEQFKAKMFTPSIDTQGELPSALSAKIIDVSGAAGEVVDGALNLNFATKLLYYKGLEELPAGEGWGWPDEESELYPRLVFFEPATSEYEQGVSLLVEERQGVAGLNRYWQKRIDQLNHARELELNIALRPEQVEALVIPNSLGEDFAAIYTLNIGGDELLCRLESVDHYNPYAKSTKCLFTTIV